MAATVALSNCTVAQREVVCTQAEGTRSTQGSFGRKRGLLLLPWDASRAEGGGLVRETTSQHATRGAVSKRRQKQMSIGSGPAGTPKSSASTLAGASGTEPRSAAAARAGNESKTAVSVSPK